MHEVTLGEVKEQLGRIKSDFDGLVELLNDLNQSNPIGGVDPGHCPPIIHPLGAECELKLFGLDNSPVTVGEAKRSVESMARWVGDILTVVDGMNPNIVLPPRM